MSEIVPQPTPTIAQQSGDTPTQLLNDAGTARQHRNRDAPPNTSVRVG
jgi:hypothetical protein